MSAWRRKAFALFPGRRLDIEQAGSVYDVLFMLGADLQAAYATGAPDAAFVDRAYRFAGWCAAPRQHPALRNAAAVGFYEHIPAYGPAARRDLATRLSVDELKALQPLFYQMLEPDVYDALEAAIIQAHGSLGSASEPQVT